MKTNIRSVLAALIFGASGALHAADVSLLNVSYDPTRELYEQYNAAFTKHWKEKTGDNVTIKQSHGGSGKQARSVIDGLEADVVTLALADDINAIAEKSKLLPENWESLLPKNSSPYTSTIVFLVRKGNPKNIKDWDDLTRKGVSVITPNPKTSGGARWNFIAAWEYAQRKFGSEDKAKEFVAKLFQNVPVLDSGARGSTTTFVERGVGDVLISWENEAFLAVRELGPDKFDIIAPPLSILAEPSVAVVEKNAKKHKTTELAKAYLEYLYSEEGQNIAGKNFYRPSDAQVAAKYANQFPKLELFTIDSVGGWKAVSKKFFADGAIFDQIYLK